MELRHLKYFVAVAEELHFGKAARKLHIAQPPLSQQIKNLEDELGLTLFDRSRRNVQLTDAGRYFLKEAQHILSQVEQAAETARRIDRGHAGRLVIGFVGSVIHTFLPKRLRSFREQYPDVELVLQEINSADQIKSLHAKSIDIGVLYLPGHDSMLASHPITQAPLMAVLPKKHALASRKLIHITELAREPFIANTRLSEPVVRDAFISMCHAAGFSPRIAQEAGQVQTVLGLVASGLGVCLLPDFIRNIKRPDVHYVPLADSPATVKLGIAWRNGTPSALISSFIGVIKPAFHPSR